MKKKYVSPVVSMTSLDRDGSLLMISGHEYDWGDAKKQSFFDEEADAQDEVAPTDKSAWDDEKNWD